MCLSKRCHRWSGRGGASEYWRSRFCGDGAELYGGSLGVLPSHAAEAVGLCGHEDLDGALQPFRAHITRCY
jgi:hypothetical protein